MFKVGDKVRCVNDDNTDCVTVGEDYIVHDFDGEFVTVDMGDGRRGGMSAYRFELVTPNTAVWQPKVGDRVRFTDKCEEYWWFGPNTPHKEGVVTGPASWTGIDGNDYQFDVEVSGEPYPAYVAAEHIEPLPVAEQPAALKIEAGKFYKTRDGRRVGPMETMPWTDDEMSVLIDGEARVFSVLGGEHVYGLRELDLIAEWADEPATAPATPVAATASNDNAAPLIDVSALIAKARKAEVNTEKLTVKLTAEASDLHEELDEIIAKLKKIRKLQRQTGLAA